MRVSAIYWSVSRRQLPSLLSLVLLHIFLLCQYRTVTFIVIPCYSPYFSTDTRKVWRRTRDNNEGNCRLLTLEKYGEERGITMKVTVVYCLVPVDGSYLHCYPSFFSILFYCVSRMQLPSFLSFVRKTRDNNEGNCRLLTLEKHGEE
jgi:hypothetical protein